MKKAKLKFVTETYTDDYCYRIVRGKGCYEIYENVADRYSVQPQWKYREFFPTMAGAKAYVESKYVTWTVHTNKQ